MANVPRQKLLARVALVLAPNISKASRFRFCLTGGAVNGIVPLFVIKLTCLRERLY